jgi:hypothetical protein
MGTSVSFRAPAVPRWQAFTAALQAQLPLERIQSELFNAGWEWEEHLGAPAVASYAVAFLDAYDTLPQRLRQADRPELALQRLVAEARAASAAEPPSAASAIAERAFASLLTRAIAGGESLAQATPEEAADRFAASRGTPAELLSGYVGELLGQYARHVTAREAGRLTAGVGEQALTVAATRRLTRTIAAAAERVGREAAPPLPEREALRAAWRPMIRDAFARGRRLPGQHP